METITVVLEDGGQYTWKWNKSGDTVMVFYTHPGCRSESIGEYTITLKDGSYHLVKDGKPYDTEGYNDFYLQVPRAPLTPVMSPKNHEKTTSPLTETKIRLYATKTYNTLNQCPGTFSDGQLMRVLEEALVQLKDSFYEKQTDTIKLQIRQGIINAFRDSQRARNARNRIDAAGEGGGARLWPMGR